MSNLIIGRNPVLETLEREEVQIERIYLQRGIQAVWQNRIRAAASKRDVPIQFVPRARLDRLVDGGRHQGVAAVAAPVAYLELEGMLNGVAAHVGTVRKEKPVLLMLDQIEDPRNYGAILRSAVAAGVRGVIVPERNMAPLSTTAVKASIGAALRVPIARTSNLVEAVQQLKERGYWVVGTAMDGEETFWGYDWDRPVVVVIGSEGRGIRPHLRRVCDLSVSIPLAGPVESLNAAVAAGIVLIETHRARIRPPTIHP